MDVQVPEEPARIANIEYTIRDQLLMSTARRYFQWQAKLTRKEIGQRVVEVGCGIGNFTNTLTDRELVVCTDAVEACVERHRQRFGGFPNIETCRMDVLDSAFRQLTRFQPDSIICLNVIEHIRDDHQAMRHMGSILGTAGRIVLLVPAFPSLSGPIDRNLNHHRRYTKRAVVDLADSAGLRIRKVIYLNFVGFFGWWVNAKILAREEHSKTQIGVFDRYVVPLQSRLEALIPPPFGQSIFAVLERR
jgi:SAM-dependent methyltransferase